MAKYKKPFRRRGPLPFRHVFIITFVIFVIFTVQGLWIINKGIKPTLLNVAETKTKQIATKAVNEAVNRRLADQLDMEKLVIVTKSDDGTITSIGWNPEMMQKVLQTVTYNAQDYLDKIEQGEMPPSGLPPDIDVEMEKNRGIIYEIPLGQATNNVLLANLGPVIPVSFSVIGSVNSNLEKKVTEYGINNALIEISVFIEASVRVVIPFATKTTTVSTDIPIHIQSIQGKVPQYFFNSSGGGNIDQSVIPPINGN